MPRFAALAGIALLLVAAALLPMAAASTRAQEAVDVVSNTPRNEFPDGVTFSLTFRPAGEVNEVRLRYELAPDGTGATAIATCTPGGAATTCTYTLTSGRGIFIIPGAEITYSWEVAAADGTRATTAEALYVHEDTRFNFRELTEGSVTVFYHSGTEDEAPGVLEATVESLQSVGALLETQVEFPIKVFLYETAEEMQPAIAPSGGRGVQILGEVVYSDTAMVSVDEQPLDITRHEIAHIVTREATKGPFDIPGWMNEGISVASQRQPLSGHANALESAIRGDRVLSMNELNSSATGGTGSTVGLYYGQAGSIIRYLIDTYGQPKFAELMRTFKSGSTVDKAFQSVYGFDSFGLENEWRESVGLDARQAVATATPAAEATPRPQPTARPNTGDDGGDDSSALTYVLIGALVVAVLAAGGVTVTVLRRRM